MSIIIEVSVGNHKNKNRQKLIARAVAHNISELADTSDYDVHTHEFGAPHFKIIEDEKSFLIKNHGRNQSVWKLIEKIVNGGNE